MPLYIILFSDLVEVEVNLKKNFGKLDHGLWKHMRTASAASDALHRTKCFLHRTDSDFLGLLSARSFSPPKLGGVPSGGVV